MTLMRKSVSNLLTINVPHNRETSQLIRNTNQLTGFYMIRIFTERFFRRDVNKRTKIKKKYMGIYIKIKMIVLKTCS